MYRFILVVLFCSSCLFSQTAKIHLSGRVTEETTLKEIQGCTVFVHELMSDCYTDSSGFFQLYLPPGHYTINFSRIGYESKQLSIYLSKNSDNQIVSINLKSKILQHTEIVVTGKKNPDPFVQEIKSKDLIRIPSGFNDILRGVTILSGVSTNNELSSGYNVHGGNYIENLIYLNGYEIYRPFLLRQGTEENQTFINPDMVESLEFFNGSFPVEFGDKMSSALSVQYKRAQPDSGSYKFRGSLLNAGVSLGQRFGNFNLNIGSRYAYPGIFLSQLQTSGQYKPFFLDFQCLVNYTLPDDDNLELFLVNSKNTYGLTPGEWNGNFQLRTLDIRGVKIEFNGSRDYSFYTTLGGLKYKNNFNHKSYLLLSASWYRNNENENTNLSDNFFYVPDSFNPNKNLEYLKTRYEKADDHLTVNQVELDATFFTHNDSHNFTAQIFQRWREVHDYINETLFETGDSAIYEAPQSVFTDSRYSADETGLFIINSFKPDNLFELNGGIRFLSEKITREFLISPRVQSNYHVNDKNTIFAGWGIYYQPPFYLERRNNNVPLISQKAIHYSAGWENKFKKNLTLRVEVYYKNLDNLIPYYTDGQKIIYTGSNKNEGYAYGLDAMVQGEIVEGIQSWIGYGYLNTKEHPKSGGDYERRLTDQNHTILIFLQDRIKKHSNWQVHTKFQFGSGMLYYLPKTVTDPTTGNKYLTVNFNKPQEFFFYFRVDMGCSTAFELKNGSKLTITAEILNVFNHYNYAGYDFIQVFKEIARPVPIPETLSPRFFNVQLEYEL